jgi:hypothetical protein
VIVRRRVPGTDEWITAEYFLPGDGRDDFELVEPLVPLKVAAIVLGLRPSTLYARAPYMASAEKHGRKLFFRTALLAVDATSEAAVPSRRQQLDDRAERRARGELRRAGAHALGCLRRHDGPCARSRRARPSDRERAQVTRSILDDLGK